MDTNTTLDLDSTTEYGFAYAGEMINSAVRRAIDALVATHESYVLLALQDILPENNYVMATFDFNGTLVKVYIDSTVEDVVTAWKDEGDRKYNEWANSDEGKAAIATRERELREMLEQREMHSLLATSISWVGTSSAKPCLAWKMECLRIQSLESSSNSTRRCRSMR